MKLNNFKQLVDNITNSIRKHAPEILLLSGVGFTFVAGIFTDRAYINTNKKIEEAGGKDIPTKEKLKIAAKEAIPAISTGCAAVVCLTQSNKIETKRYSSLAAAYAISENKFKEYKNQVLETVGEKKEKSIHDKAVEETIKKNEDEINSKPIVITGHGNVQCVDLISNQVFESNWDSIKDAQNTINYRLCTERFISINEIFDELGLPHIKTGDDYGWLAEYGPYEINITTTERNKIPCLAIDFDIHHRGTSYY